MKKQKNTRSVSSASKERGLALLVVLWVVAVGAILVTIFNLTARTGLVVADSEMELSKRNAAIDAGLEIAVAKLLHTKEEDSWRPNEVSDELRYQNYSIKLSVRDANSLVDINKADDKILLNLFERISGGRAFSKSMVREIKEVRLKRQPRLSNINDASSGRRDKETAPSERKPQRDRSQIGSDKNGSVVKGRVKLPTFQDVTDLLALKSMSDDLFKRLAPYATTTSADGRINIFTAPDAVLKSVPGLTSADIDRFRVSQKFALKEEKNSFPSALQGGRPYLSTKAGPGFLVTVRVSSERENDEMVKQFIIVMGLDKKVPYHLISSKLLL